MENQMNTANIRSTVLIDHLYLFTKHKIEWIQPYKFIQHVVFLII